MEKKKTSIKSLPQKEATKSDIQEGGEISNRLVFTVYAKNPVDQIKKALPLKPCSVKQVIVVSLLMADEPTRKEILDLVRENKSMDRAVEGFIIDNKKKILDFFSGQKNKTSTTTVLKQRIAELEAKVGEKK